MLLKCMWKQHSNNILYGKIFTKHAHLNLYSFKRDVILSSLKITKKVQTFDQSMRKNYYILAKFVFTLLISTKKYSCICYNFFQLKSPFVVLEIQKRTQAVILRLCSNVLVQIIFKFSIFELILAHYVIILYCLQIKPFIIATLVW